MIASWRHRKSTQVHARPGQTESQLDPSFQLETTCESVWPGLNKLRLSDQMFFLSSLTSISKGSSDITAFKKISLRSRTFALRVCFVSGTTTTYWDVVWKLFQNCYPQTWASFFCDLEYHSSFLISFFFQWCVFVYIHVFVVSSNPASLGDLEPCKCLQAAKWHHLLPEVYLFLSVERINIVRQTFPCMCFSSIGPLALSSKSIRRMLSETWAFQLTFKVSE